MPFLQNPLLLQIQKHYYLVQGGTTHMQNMLTKQPNFNRKGFQMWLQPLKMLQVSTVLALHRKWKYILNQTRKTTEKHVCIVYLMTLNTHTSVSYKWSACQITWWRLKPAFQSTHFAVTGQVWWDVRVRRGGGVSFMSLRPSRNWKSPLSAVMIQRI